MFFLRGVYTLCRVWHAQDYGLSRDDLDFVFSVTQFKSKADWAADPMKVRHPPASLWLPDIHWPSALHLLSFPACNSRTSLPRIYFP